MTWYAHRTGGVIKSLHRVPQPGYADEAVADNHADVLAFLAASAPDYRQKRKEAYADQLGKTPGSVVDTLGDVLDVLIAQVEANRVAAGVAMTADYATMLTKIAAIKAANQP